MGGRRNGSFRNILIGYDGSEAAEKALELAFALARTMDSKLDILSVVQPPEPATTAELQAVIDDARKQYEKSLQRIANSAHENGLQADTRVVVGHPAEQILAKAEQDHTDLIIVGQRGMSTFQKLLMGSVSERVLRYAPCPVLVARCSDKGKARVI